jgi:hypothetical protein
MPSSVPLSYHLDFYRYWHGKRSSQAVPPRNGIDPTEIPALLPNIGIIEKTGGEFRYRLMGTSLVQQLGFDATGASVGAYIGAGQALRDTVELACTSANPVFNTGRYEAGHGLVHRGTMQMLPLSGDGKAVNMVVFLGILRFHPFGRAGRDWLRNAPIKIGEPVLIRDDGHLETIIAAWEQA